MDEDESFDVVEVTFRDGDLTRSYRRKIDTDPYSYDQMTLRMDEIGKEIDEKFKKAYQAAGWMDKDGNWLPHPSPEEIKEFREMGYLTDEELYYQKPDGSYHHLKKKFEWEEDMLLKKYGLLKEGCRIVSKKEIESACEKIQR